MDNNPNYNPVEYKMPNSLAAIWSMMLPGLGQLLKGMTIPGILWAIITGCGYFSYFWPGVFFHTLCVLDAAFHKNEGSILSFNTWPQRLVFVALVIFLVVYIYYRNTY